MEGSARERSTKSFLRSVGHPLGVAPSKGFQVIQYAAAVQTCSECFSARDLVLRFRIGDQNWSPRSG